jgi:hypothetical protein
VFELAATNYNITAVNKSFENVSKFKYMKTVSANRNEVYDEIRRIINSRNIFYLVQGLLSSALISKHTKDKDSYNNHHHYHHHHLFKY